MYGEVKIKSEGGGGRDEEAGRNGDGGGDVGAYVPRKRKSNFDVTPEEMMTSTSVNGNHLSSLSSSSVVNVMNLGNGMGDIHSKLLMFSNFTAAAAAGGVSVVSDSALGIPFYQSVNEAYFIAKLDKALTRNFEYICRY
jgi:hypothetical protein